MTEKKSQQLRVHYEQTSVLYASQFVLNVTSEELIINFSSGNLPDPVTGDAHLPIHSRIALSREGTKRLIYLLGQALGSDNQTNTASGSAKLPTLDKTKPKQAE